MSATPARTKVSGGPRAGAGATGNRRRRARAAVSTPAVSTVTMPPATMPTPALSPSPPAPAAPPAPAPAPAHPPTPAAAATRVSTEPARDQPESALAPRRADRRAAQKLARRSQQRWAIAGCSILAATFGLTVGILDVLH